MNDHDARLYARIAELEADVARKDVALTHIEKHESGEWPIGIHCDLGVTPGVIARAALTTTPPKEEKMSAHVSLDNDSEVVSMAVEYAIIARGDFSDARAAHARREAHIVTLEAALREIARDKTHAMDIARQALATPPKEEE